MFISALGRGTRGVQLENKAGRPTRSTSAAPSGRFICHGFPKSSCALSEWAGPWERAIIFTHIYAYLYMIWPSIVSQQTLSIWYIPSRHGGGVGKGLYSRTRRIHK